MGASMLSEDERKQVVNRLADVQASNVPYLTEEVSRYHELVNKHSYFSSLPEVQKRAWVKYGLDHITAIYLRAEHHEDTAWEKNLAMSSTGGGFRGVSESIGGMIVMSHLLVPLVRAEFATDPVMQSYALSLLQSAYRNLFEKSIKLYSDYVRVAYADMNGSFATKLEDIKVDGLLVESETYSDISVYRLTKRELEVLHLVGLGYENGEICTMLDLKLDTVKGHIRNIMSKTLLHNRTQLALLAMTTEVCNKAEIAAAVSASQY